MSKDRPATPDGMDEVASRFGELWRALTVRDGQPRDAEERRMLVDRARDALDRGLQRLDRTAPPRFVADTFALQEPLHEGDRTHVHRLRHRDLGTDYVLKTLAPKYADDAIARDLLLREARLHMQLRHPRIVTAHIALRLPDGRPGLVLEWMGGGSLSRLRARTGGFTLRSIHVAMTALLEGVKAIHDAGLVHADIAPGNLLFATDDPATLKVADFGIALAGGESHAPLGLSAAGRSVKGAADARADLHGCGEILVLLLESRTDDGPAAAGLQELAAALTSSRGAVTNAEQALSLLYAIEP